MKYDKFLPWRHEVVVKNEYSVDKISAHAKTKYNGDETTIQYHAWYRPTVVIRKKITPSISPKELKKQTKPAKNQKKPPFKLVLSSAHKNSFR
jgi:hypothetical protein